MNSFKHNFNDNASIEVKRSELNDGQFLVSVTTREFYVSGPELEQFGYSIWEMLKGEDNEQEDGGGEPSEPESSHEESIEEILSDSDTRSS